MAEKTDKILCSICLGDFTNPKLLECNHRFCFTCLQGYINKFTVDDHFPCPLCRRSIRVKDFSSNSLSTTGDGQQNQELCDVCKIFNCNFQCTDCDKLLCFSCKSTHDIFYASNNHNVKDLMKTGPKIPGGHSDYKPKDLCSNHCETEVRVHCIDCSVVVCSLCFISHHNGHQFLGLTEEHKVREELKTLKRELKNQISRFKTFSDSLEAKGSQVVDMAEKIHSQVKDQIHTIYDELNSLGEKTMVRVTNWRDEETDKLIAMNKEMQIECENVREMVDSSHVVLENKSLIQNQRKLDIPVVKSVKFLEGKINSVILSQQLGHVEISGRSSLEVGLKMCFTTNIDMSDVTPGDVTRWNTADGNDVISWSIGACHKNYSQRDPMGGKLGVSLRLNNITDQTIQHVDITFKYKLINKNNVGQSVTKKYTYTNRMSRGSVLGEYDLAEYRPFINRQNGFLDINDNFKIKTTITIMGLHP